jgi:hypothetical protein
MQALPRSSICTLAIAVAAVAACAPAAAPPRFPARPPGCELETFTVLPRRPYIELETFNLNSSESLTEAVGRVRDSACGDGADAIYAPKAGKAYVYGIALKWSDAPPPAPAPVTPPPRV